MCIGGAVGGQVVADRRRAHLRRKRYAASRIKLHDFRLRGVPRAGVTHRRHQRAVQARHVAQRYITVGRCDGVADVNVDEIHELWSLSIPDLQRTDAPK